ncbi:hypothetical protein DPMN_148921 [Dreissena polymorpha]|uniref:Uncharacterized protein n=1 Tax=Dreissena polymorpha TaxID=45954 RepID=A0A9D4FEZ6_DREPO|nr:hypothetical protein DPMN_148921 [Dreissena polymorpha]
MCAYRDIVYTNRGNKGPTNCETAIDSDEKYRIPTGVIKYKHKLTAHHCETAMGINCGMMLKCAPIIP